VQETTVGAGAMFNTDMAFLLQLPVGEGDGVEVDAEVCCYQAHWLGGWSPRLARRERCLDFILSEFLLILEPITGVSLFGTEHRLIKWQSVKDVLQPGFSLFSYVGDICLKSAHMHEFYACGVVTYICLIRDFKQLCR